MNTGGGPVAVQAPGRRVRRGTCGLQTTEDGKVCAGIFQNRFGAHHKHAQALARGFQQVAAAHQQHRVSRWFEADKTGLHTPFGRAKSCQTRLPRRQQQKVLGQLVVDKRGGVGTGDADDAQVGEGGSALGGSGDREGHAGNYDCRHTLCGSAHRCAHGSYGL